MKLEIIRKYYTEGTNGDILLNGVKLCSSIELPWKNNEARISCIPEGVYLIAKRYSPKFGNHILVKDVPGRQLILIHPANDAIKELKGCIAPVLFLQGIGKGSLSKKALALLKETVYTYIEKGEEVTLTIRR